MELPFLTEPSGETCSCGTSITSPLPSALDPSSASLIACTRSTTEYCGGSDLFQLYSRAAVSGSSTASGVSSTASPSSTISPSIVPSSGSYVNQGLFGGSSTNPLVIQSTPSTSPISVDSCATACASYDYFEVTGGMHDIDPDRARLII